MKRPNRIELKNGSYLLFDTLEGKWRIAVYRRKVSKSETLENALARALDKPPWDKEIKEIAKYISGVEKFEGLTLE